MKLVDLIAGIKKRPGMYLGSKSIQCLRCFLSGYMLGIGENDTDNFVDDYVRFREWVARKFHVTTTHGWVEIIIYHLSINEYEAYEEFFILFEEFVKCTNEN